MKDLSKEDQSLKQSWIEKYGCDGWYSWSNKNWGTKWPASEIEITEGKNCLKITCETAWSDPEELLKFLSLQYPKVQIDITYEVESFEATSYSLKNGERR